MNQSFDNDLSQTRNERSIYEKWFHVFTAGSYPQGDFTAEDLAQIAGSYNPAYIEAPVWIGHPGDDGPEPEAYGWIKEIKAEGNNLFVKFDYIDPELVEKINSRRFKRCSVELWYIADVGWYLTALGVTNRPQVKSLPAMQFQECLTFTAKVVKSVFLTFKNKLQFTKEEHEAIKLSNLKTTKKNKTMNLEILKKFAQDKGIDTAACANDDELINKVFQYFEEYEKDAEAKAVKFADETKTLEERVKEFEERELSAIIDTGIVAKRVLASERDSMLQYGKDTSADKLRKFIEARPVQAIFAEKSVDTSAQVNTADKKFFKADGSKLTYQDFLHEVRRNPELAEKFTEAEIDELRKSWF